MRRPAVRKILRITIVGLGIAALLFGVYVYRTIQRGRMDAQAAILENLNPGGEFLGPEGIAFDSSGRLYVGDAGSRVWRLQPGGRPEIHADLTRVEGGPPGPIHAGGMAFDGAERLLVCAYGYAGGSVLRVEPGGRVELFARDLGVANYLIVSADQTHLWVSDYRKSGRVLRYDLASAVPARPDLVLDGFDYPNGLAFGRDEATLFAAETYSGRVARVRLGGPGPAIDRLIDLKGEFAAGSLDGLAFDPRDKGRRFLYVAENIRGMFTVVDVEARPARVVKQLALSMMGGRPCPASMTIRDGYLYFTDLWSCSPIRILLGFPKLHNNAYRVRITDLGALY
jgi:sugar lactone lactonase YvrE